MLSIPERLSGFAGKVQELFKTSPSEAAPSNVTSNTNDRTEANSLVPVPSAEELRAPVVGRSGKRSRDEEEVSSGRSGKSSRRSGSANDLVPNYQRRPPPNSMPIAVPKYNPGADWKPKQTPAMGAPHRRQSAFRPTNTLSQPSQQSARSVQPTHRCSGRGTAELKATRQPGLEISKSKGSNVGIRSGLLDDIDSEAPAAKRRKVDSTPKSDTVDLISDDEDSEHHLDLTKGQPIPAKNASRISASQNSVTELSDRSRRKQKGGGDAFGNNELYNTDQQSNNWRPRTARGRSKAGGPPVLQPDVDMWKENRRCQQLGTAQTPVELHADPSAGRDDRLSSSRNAEQNDVAEVPVIDLNKGVREAGEEHRQKRQKREQGSAEDLKRVNNVMAHAGYVKPADAQKRAKMPANVRRSGPQHSIPALSLNKNFKRDVEDIEDDDPPVKTGRSSNAPTRAQSPSSRLQTRDHSPDVLHGGSTVRSQNSRSASPKKLVPVIPLRRAGTASKEFGSHVSASRLQPTKFTRSQQVNLPEHAGDDEDIWNSSEDLHQDGNIPIVSIASKAIVNDDRGLALRWDPGTQSFILVNGQDLVRSPLDGGVVSIGAKAVSNHWQGHDHSKKVALRGSASDNSTGIILIDFATLDAKWDCYNGLHESLEGLSTRKEDPNRLEKIFANMRHEQVRAHDHALKIAHDRAKKSQIAELRRKQGTEQGDEDQIVYASQPSQTKRRKLVEEMRGTTISEVLAEEAQRSVPRHTRQNDSQTTSQYFAPTEPTRRSTRQSIPTKQYHEPSPEPYSWTKENGLPNWPKPVVYPEEGPRRVTIDVNDLKHLDAGEFLNDNILNYALRNIEESLPTEQKHRFHFFNTFFFTSLTAKNGKRAFNYEAVRKWTKNVDLFTKEFVVVPINLDLHWFVIVIHNLPLLDRKLLDSDDLEQPAEDTVDLESDNEVVTPQSDGPQSKLQQMTLSDIAENATDGPIADGPKLPGHDTALGEGEMSSMKSKKGKKKKPVPPIRKFPTNQATIVSLDSFGVKRTHEAAIIKEYIIAEAAEKRQMKVTKKDIQGVNASGIPQQNNFYDCGVYLIGYMKEFVLDPDRFVKRILGRELDTSDFAAFDTTALRDEVRENLVKYGKMASDKYRSEKLAKRKAQSEGGKTPSKNLATSTTAAGNISNDAVPASSQASRNSPSAHRRSSRQATPSAPSALKTPSTSTQAVRGSPEPPTSTTFPRASKETHPSVEDDNDELEVGVPRALQTSKSPRSRGREISPAANEGNIEADGEMLDAPDVPEKNSRFSVHRAATPLRSHDSVGHNLHLSPLSSLEQDAYRSTARSAPSVSDARATVTGVNTPKEEIKEEDDIKIEDDIKQEAADEDKPTLGVKVEEQDVKSDATDIKSESDEAESDQGRLTVISIPDEGEPDPLAEEDPKWQGFDDGHATRPVEIPDSQPETQQSLLLQ